jgi:hypothetical protein
MERAKILTLIENRQYKRFQDLQELRFRLMGEEVRTSNATPRGCAFANIEEVNVMSMSLNQIRCMKSDCRLMVQVLHFPTAKRVERLTRSRKCLSDQLEVSLNFEARFNMFGRRSSSSFNNLSLPRCVSSQSIRAKKGLAQTRLNLQQGYEICSRRLPLVDRSCWLYLVWDMSSARVHDFDFPAALISAYDCPVDISFQIPSPETPSGAHHWLHMFCLKQIVDGGSSS